MLDSNVGAALHLKEYYHLLKLVLFLFNHLTIHLLYLIDYILTVFKKGIMDIL